MFGRSRNLVGLDIGDSSVKVVELKDLGKGRGHQLLKLGWEPLSTEAIVDGQIMDAQLVTETIQRLFQRCKIKASSQVATALSGHHVIVKRISLPVMGGEGAHPPADACDFARHCAALDFWSINDHAANITPRDWSETIASIREVFPMFELTLDGLEKAVAHHQAGRLQEAEDLYRQVLSVDPEQPDALYLLGVIAHIYGHHKDAVDLVGRAARARPSAAQYHITLGQVLVSLQEESGSM